MFDGLCALHKGWCAVLFSSGVKFDTVVLPSDVATVLFVVPGSSVQVKALVRCKVQSVFKFLSRQGWTKVLGGDV